MIGVGSGSDGALNLIVPVVGEYEIADRSRERCVRRTLRSVGLMDSVSRVVEKLDTNNSREKMREVFEVAIFDAWSRTAFAAACRAS